MTPNFPEPVTRARWSVTYGDHAAPLGVSASRTESRQQILTYFTSGELHTKPRLGARGSMAVRGFSRPSSSASTFRFQNDDIWLPTPIRPRGRNIPIPTQENLVLRNNGRMKKSIALPGGIVHFRNLDTQAPQVGPSFLASKGKNCYRAASAGK